MFSKLLSLWFSISKLESFLQLRLFDSSIHRMFCLQLSVLAGDFLLSRACVALAALGNTEVN
jgi:hypothetical protein